MTMPQRSVESVFATAESEEAGYLKQLFISDRSLKMKSEIPPGLIVPLARAYVVARKTGSRILEKYCDTILELQISKDRKGRIEMMECLTAMRRREDEEL